MPAFGDPMAVILPFLEIIAVIAFVGYIAYWCFSKRKKKPIETTQAPDDR